MWPITLPGTYIPGQGENPIYVTQVGYRASLTPPTHKGQAKVQGEVQALVPAQGSLLHVSNSIQAKMPWGLMCWSLHRGTL